MRCLPVGKGTYAVILFLKRRCCIRVGMLGEREFRRGYYLYVGSALGAGGLAARVNHHLRSTARPHWHIDYLGNASRPRAVWFTLSDIRLEHAWAAAVAGMPGVDIPVEGFGSTDCGCPSHLFCFPRQPVLRIFHEHLLNSGFRQDIQAAKGSAGRTPGNRQGGAGTLDFSRPFDG